MSTAPPATRDLARRLIALEVARDESPGTPTDGAIRVCDRLRLSLSRLTGVAGFRCDAAYKVPALFHFSAQPLPRLGTGKIDRVALKQQFSA